METTISATELGTYASSRFCLHCAWVRLHVKKLPFQSFPGIFSTIDRYNKLIVQNHFEREGTLPAWLQQLGEAGTCVNPPHWSSFKVLDEESGITLRGEADGIFQMRDGSYTIVDYKTSKYSSAQQGMFRAYEVQLNAYAYIGNRLGFSPVSRLALVYMEPMTGEEKAMEPHLVDDRGFSMGFEAKVVDVELRPETLIPRLLKRVKEVVDMDRPPQGSPECKDCQALDGLISALDRGG